MQRPLFRSGLWGRVEGAPPVVAAWPCGWSRGSPKIIGRTETAGDSDGSGLRPTAANFRGCFPCTSLISLKVLDSPHSPSGYSQGGAPLGDPMTHPPRAHVLVTHPVVDGALDILLETVELTVADGLEDEAALAEAVRGKSALLSLLTAPVTEAVMRAGLPTLRIVANHAVGYDNVDIAAAARLGVVVTNTPGVLTEATADLTWAALLGVVRRVAEGDRMMRSGGYRGWSPTLLLGSDLRGKTLGIVGLGQIGRAVARRSAGFGMRVLHHDPGHPGPVDLGLVRSEGRTLEALLSESDVVSLHVPLTPQTHHLLSAERLALLRPTAFLVNTSRGPVVDEAALVHALRRGALAGAALDVYEHEPALAPGLGDLPNTLLLPHIGSATRETRYAMAHTAALNIHALLRGDPPPNRVA